ncbi:histidine phosphatase family protein [Pseudorhodobacter turbinis]|uniref:Histidine phosphatase family protein n=1 Tax=Pseudorhodobacter turbinis TaxID=2500533 RepID=A0A4P8EET4_9RHOB|nr:histidine phosphatase family protein [Pseudorhodobacter turbinis]QCO55249.1 histidine phosphatase family protein [Pseudorhodobacter turbinis]
MTKRLILTRHAKSSWDDPLMSDHDRPLNDRGNVAAADLGQWLASRGYIPGEVLCSDALRTQETYVRIAAEMPDAAAVTLKPALYNAGPDVLLAVLRKATAETVMIIAHNPGIAEFAARLVARAPANAEFPRYPTGATLVVDFTEDDWKGVAFGAGATLDFVIPREIAA